MCIDGHFSKKIKIKKHKKLTQGYFLKKKKTKINEKINIWVLKKNHHVVNLEVNSKGIFGSSFHELFSLSFLSILERKLFDGPEEKKPRPHYLFSSLSIQPNTLQKVFLPIFFPKFSIHHISPPNKHTLKDISVCL